MGLLIDRSGIPLGFDLFPGNESEKVHMRPIIETYRRTYPEGRTIIVADRGLNTADNIFYINGTNTSEINNRDGYIYGQSVRGASEEFKKWVLKREEYITETVPISKDPIGPGLEKDDIDTADSNIIFMHKSRIEKRTIEVNVTLPDGKKKKQNVMIDQKQMAYYSEKYAKRQQQQRDIMVERAKDLIAHPQKYDKVTAKGSASYVVNLSFDSQGTIVEGKTLLLDEKKIEEEARYDGYYSIVTSELKMSDLELRNAYRGLAKIEDTFKISKSDFNARPIFVRTNEHIDAHFTVCFISLLIIRLLQIKLNSQYSIGRILKSLRRYSCVNISGAYYKTIFYDSVIRDCRLTFGLPLQYEYRTRDQLRRLLRY